MWLCNKQHSSLLKLDAYFLQVNDDYWTSNQSTDERSHFYEVTKGMRKEMNIVFLWLTCSREKAGVDIWRPLVHILGRNKFSVVH